MRVKKQAYKLISILLSVLLLFAVVPLSASADDTAGATTEFVSENLLRKEGAVENSKAIMFYANLWGSVYEANDTASNRIPAEVVSGVIDGKYVHCKDFYAYGTTDSRWFGILYTLKETTYCDSAVVYAGLSNIPDCYRVYASDSSDDLCIGDNLQKVICRGETDGVKVELHKKVKYIAVIYDSPSSNELVEGSTTARMMELELYSGDEATDFKSENLLLSETKTSEARAVKMDRTTGAVTDYASNQAKAKTVFAGNSLYTHTDIYQDDAYKSGFQFSFNEPYYIGDVLIDAGHWKLNETYEIYASNDINTLYSADSLVASNVECKFAGGNRYKLNKKVKYLAIFQTATDGGMRVRQIAVYTADTTGVDIPEVFVSENVLQTKLAKKAEPIVRFVSDGSISYESGFGSNLETKIAQMTDGNVSDHFDLAGTLEWDPKRYAGAEFTLKETVYIGKINLYAGYVKNPETYTVYASNTLEDLYTSGSMVAENALATENSTISADVNREIKYVAFICESYSGNPRFKEIEAWTAEPKDDIFVSENLLRTKLTSSKGVDMFAESGNIVDSNNFSAANITAVTDGNIAEWTDLSGGGAPTWTDNPRYVGAMFTLDNTYYVDYVSIYAGINADSPESWRVYASNSEDNLYSEANLVLADTVCEGEEQKGEIKKDVKYIAFFCTADSGNARPREFELWSGDPATKPETPDEPDTPVLDGIKVLTIGNSFAENTSIYASEIAKANGQDLTFGYLKYPSCSIDMHYQAATENLAVFKFNITKPDGTRLRIKQQESSFDAPNSEVSATIKEALEYADWDVIVFQQDSNNARNYNTFSNLGGLVEYVKGFNSDAKLMFHEVWRWGEWNADQFELIKANAERAAIENGLDIIPTGLAFEYARTALKSDTVVNENDGNYQHANAYGQYIAGAVYTAKLFGIEIDASKMAAHPVINNSDYIEALTAAANNAVTRYENRGDIDGDGTITATDLSWVVKYILSGDATTVLADATRDGKVDIIDIVRIKKLMANAA